MDKIVALCKRRGFIYPGSEIYGGLGGTWDYGPLGVELKNNIKREWWKDMVQLREDIVGVDAAIMMNPKAWEASGHVEAFTDPLVECKVCHKRFRKDQFDEFLKSVPKGVGNVAPKKEFIELFICSTGKHHELEKLTKPKLFNLLVEAFLGVTDPKQKIYLRGEITNGVHVNFKNVIDSTRVKIPFGIAQIGKAFRNEITPGNFTFRSREFEQMEVQYYIEPKEMMGEKWFEYWRKQRMNWYLSLGVKKENLRFREHEEKERAHYARSATDIEYNSPFGWSEFEGIHHRGDWDLSRHEQYSGQSMKYRDPDSGDEYLPWVIETSGGVDRAALFFLIDSYREEGGRTVLKLHPKLAPYKVAVFPLLANKPELVKLAKSIYLDLKQSFMAAWDDRGNIGKRYASQDEIGTPFCVTVDFQSLEDQTVTVRNRDSAKQDRVKIVDLQAYLSDKIEG
ncbi:glycine--tRNA ligase [Candidatus Daviesbacteria bacterium]|nr:glycine--tRNA ligase [Candidatus Daviesbacteria bacterium]